MTPETPLEPSGADDSLIPPSLRPWCEASAARAQAGPAAGDSPTPHLRAPGGRPRASASGGTLRGHAPAPSPSASPNREPPVRRRGQPAGDGGSPRQPRPVPQAPRSTRSGPPHHPGPLAGAPAPGPTAGPVPNSSAVPLAASGQWRARGGTDAPRRPASPPRDGSGGPRPDPAAARPPRQPDAPGPGPSRAARPGGLYPAARTSPSAPSARRPVACWLPVPRRTRGTDTSGRPRRRRRPLRWAVLVLAVLLVLVASASGCWWTTSAAGSQGRRPLRGHEHPGETLAHCGFRRT